MTTNLAIDGHNQPVVFLRDDTVFANRRDVAAFFGKRHDHVLRDIDRLIEQEPSLIGHPLPRFGEGVYTMPATRDQQHRMFDMTRDGFTLLAMGFTGTKALQWKLRYIEAFNTLETEFRSRSQVIDLNDPAQLRQLLLSYNEKHEQLTKQVEELLPAQDELDRIAQADGSFCITDTAKLLQMRPKDLFIWLQENGWIYRRRGGSSFLGYHSKTSTSLLEHKVTTVLRADGSEKVTEQVRVTSKGLVKLSALIKPPLQ